MDDVNHTGRERQTRARARRWLLAPLWIALLVLVWEAWPFLPSAFRNPFYAMSLSFRRAPTALPVPVAGVRPGQLRDTWGAPRGNGRGHEGVDIFAPRGTPVFSTTEGLVTRIGASELGGKSVWILGPGGQHHYYAHLDTYADLRVGDRVSAGTMLGTVGNTGNARNGPPHLHYGIYADGSAIDPYPLLRWRGAATAAAPR